MSLASSDPDELTVPSEVTIPAGQSSAVFYATPVNDGTVDADAAVTITASVPDVDDVSKQITVRNVQTPALSVTTSVAELTEGAPNGADQFTITITRDYVTDDALLVDLAASQSGQISLPAFVTIPGGDASITIDSYAYNDQVPEKTESVGIAAIASGWQSGDTYLTLHDDDIPGLSVVLDSTVMSEGGGTQALAGTVSRDEVSNVDIRVRFSSSDTTEAYVPRDVIIRAGQDSATFYIAAIEDDLFDGTQTVTLTASIIVPSCGCGVDPHGEEVTATFDVLDNDGPTLTLDLEPQMTAEGIVDAVTATVWRNTPTDEDLVVTLESSDESEMIAPPTVTIRAGSSQASIKLDTVQDDVVDGDQVVTITASVDGYTSGIGQVIVTDRDLPDLVIDSIQAPTGAVHTDSTFDITYRVENRGLAEAISSNADPGSGFEGSWIDRVFLSDDPYVGDDILIGNYTYTGTLSNVAGANGYQRTVSMDAPFETGDYWVVVQTDLGTDVHEGLETNNAKITATPVHVSAAYSASVETDVTVAPAGTPIELTGQALDADSGDPVAYAQVNIHIKLRGYNRVISAICDESGTFQTTWSPLPTEAGQYTVGACHPGETSAPVQDSFTLVGMKAEPASRTLTVIEGGSATSSVTLRNLSDVPLTGVTVEIIGDVAENLGVVLAPVSTFLGGSATQTVSFTISAADASVLNSSFTIRVSSAEAPSIDIPVNVRVTALQARLSANPGTLTAGMLRGEQTLVEFTVRNTGGKATGPLEVMLPEVDWMHLVSEPVMASLEPGESAPVTVQLTPSESITLGEHVGSLVLMSPTTSMSLPFTFRAMSEGVGDLRITVTDEYTYFVDEMPMVADATITVVDAIDGSLITSGTSRDDGIYVVSGLPEGYYNIDVRADKHRVTRITLLVEAGVTQDAEVFLARETVTYNWTVTPVESRDDYNVSITADFEANVPLPILVMDPAIINLSDLSLPESQFDITLRNEGLIALEDVRIDIPVHPFYQFTPLVREVGCLPAGASVTIPVLVEDIVAQSSVYGFDPEQLDNMAATEDAEGDQLTASITELATDNVKGRQGYLPPISYSSFFSFPENKKFLNCVRAALVGAARDIKQTWNTTGIFVGDNRPYSSHMEAARSIFIGTVEITLGETDDVASFYGSTIEISPSVLQRACSCDEDAEKYQELLEAALGHEIAHWVDANDGGINHTDETGYQGEGYAWMKAAYGGRVKTTGATGPVQGTPVGGVVQEWEPLSGTPAGPWSRIVKCQQPSVKATGRAQCGNQYIERVASTTILDAYLCCPSGPSGATGTTGTTAHQNSTPQPSYSGPSYVADTYVSCNVVTKTSAALQSQFPPASDQMVEETAEEGICAKVGLQVDQAIVLARDAFQATLELSNLTNTPLENINLDITIVGADGTVETSRFGIHAPTLTNLTAVDGTGLLQSYATGTAHWLIVPMVDAASNGSKDYVVGGVLRYIENGVPVEISLTGVTITVLPQPALELDYFWQRDVIADDPWTDEVEPSVPFELAVLIQNYGAGEATNLRIESSQPQIVENEKGLLVDFNIIGSEIDGEETQPSLNLNFGDIEPGDTTIGRWFMTSSILGHFIEYEATFRHLDGLGDDRLSLIKDVDIHELIHTVSAYGDFDDGKSDFLVNELADELDLPDTLYLSDGSVMDVAQVTNITADGDVNADDYVIELTADMSDGWNYFRVEDPGAADYEVVRVVRREEDGRLTELPLENVWQTAYTFIGGGLRPVEEDILHLFDYGTAAGYTLYYEPRDQIGPVVTTLPIFRDLSQVDPEVVELLNLRDLMQEDPVDTIEIEFSKAIDPASFTRDDLALIRDQSANLITDAVNVERIDETHYRISGLATLNEEGGDYAIVVYTEGIRDTFGNDGSGVWSTGWTKLDDSPAVVSVSGAPTGERSTPVESIEIIFSEPIDLSTFGPDDISLRCDDGDNLLTAPLQIVQVSDRTYRLEGLGDLTATDGEYDLLIDMTDVTDLDGVAGLGDWWSNWTMDTGTPSVDAITGLDAEFLNSPVNALTVEFSEAIQSSSLDPAALTLTRDGTPIALGGVSFIQDSGTEYRIIGLTALTAEEAEYTLTIDSTTVQDLAGNAGSGSRSVSWTVDTTAPEPAGGLSISPDTGLNDSDGVTSSNTVTLSGTLSEADLIVTIYDETTGADLGPATVNGLSFAKEITFTSPGTHRLRVEVADPAGNTADATLDVFIDRTDLTVTAWEGVPSEPADETIDNVTVVFSDSIDPSTFTLATMELTHGGVVVDLASEGVTLNPIDDTQFQLENLPDLGAGTYTVTVNTTGIAKQSSGRTGAESESVSWTVLDTQRPTVVDIQIQDGGTSFEEVDHFTVTFSEAMNIPELLGTGAVNTAIRLTRATAEGMPISDIADLSSGTFGWDSATNTLSWQADVSQSLAPGWYELQLDSDLFQDLAGNQLLGTGTAETPFGVPQFDALSKLQAADGNPASVAAYSAPAFGDYNGDGVDDLLVGEKSTDGQGRIVVFLNTGTTAAPVYEAGVTIADPVVVAASGCLGASPYWGDFNADGLSDLLVGTADGSVIFFENIGMAGAPAFADGQSVLAGPAGGKSPISVGARATVDMADLNGDGRNDLMVGDISGRIQVFYDQATSGTPNLAAGEAVQIQGDELSVSSGRAAVKAVDFDGDGRLDLLAGNTNGELWLYRNAGTATEPAFLSGSQLALTDGSEIDLAGTPRSRPAVADLNGDGILDLVVGSQDGTLQLYEGQPPTDNHVTHFTVVQAVEPLSLDVGDATHQLREGETLLRTGSFAGGSMEDTFTATVDYGDGSGVEPLTLTGREFTLEHVYADDGDFTLVVTVTSFGGETVSGEIAVEVIEFIPIPGDLDGDGKVNGSDLNIVRSHWGERVTPGSLLEGDVSGDGYVGSADLDEIRSNWGVGVPAACSAATMEVETTSPVRKALRAPSAHFPKNSGAPLP